MVDLVYFFSFWWYEGFVCDWCVIVQCKEGVDDWQIVFVVEIEVVLVMCWIGKDCVGVIVYQDEVGDLDWQFLIRVQWVFYFDVSVKVQFFFGFDGFFSCVIFVVFGDKFGDIIMFGFELFGNWMIW